MAASTDKARFYLEQQVPELLDYERKNIFSKEEITSIAARRSDFEHTLSARGSHPSDYALYTTYESNLAALRAKRCKRLGIKKGASQHAGSRRIFFILERGVKKFPGDLGLWMQYLDFCKQEKAHKKLEIVLTNCLRLHPTKAEMWVWGARWKLETEGDIKAARSYMQRGLRFCQKERWLWVEYARLEMIYCAKIAGRRRILGLDAPKKKDDVEEEDGDQEMIKLPTITAEDVNPSLDKDDAVDEEALQHLANTPALTGAIPMAIFDTAMAQFKSDERLAEAFFDLFSEFDQVPCAQRILQHILERLEESIPQSATTILCGIKLLIASIDRNSAEFPAALGRTLANIKAALKQSPDIRQALVEGAIRWILPLTRESDLDVGLQKVISASLRQYLKALAEGSKDENEACTRISKMANALKNDRRSTDAKSLLEAAERQFGEKESLVRAKASMQKT
ncbi:rRNA processing protein Utp6 [Aulographum hederae CBS 113979]|uniref:rRNA processing protein Utp6 n=1 Tax=Aulographum hederae CBS 113979 TaxID=1176131 RepID=A0A6G1H5B9_9PEZI|nr:rRNA processing protein Utp6 [Aulographum hederae CBS 113979]